MQLKREIFDELIRLINVDAAKLKESFAIEHIFPNIKTNLNEKQKLRNVIIGMEKFCEEKYNIEIKNNQTIHQLPYTFPYLTEIWKYFYLEVLNGKKINR